jgi:hypothetical protein
VHVRLVDGAALEVHLGEAQVATFLTDGGLVIDLADEDRIVGPLAPGLCDAYHPHMTILAQTGGQ